MIAKAKARFVRMSPRKIRYVVDLVKGKPVPEAYAILDHVPRKASIVVKKLIRQAATSAKRERQKEPESLYVSELLADGAGMLKRYRAMSMGRAGDIRKRLSHVRVELDEVRGVVPAKPEGGTPTHGAKRRGWAKKLVGAAR